MGAFEAYGESHNDNKWVRDLRDSTLALAGLPFASIDLPPIGWGQGIVAQAYLFHLINIAVSPLELGLHAFSGVENL